MLGVDFNNGLVSSRDIKLHYLYTKVMKNGDEQVGEELKAEHPSSFWIKDLGLLLIAYVDGLLLSVPTQNIPHHSPVLGQASQVGEH